MRKFTVLILTLLVVPLFAAAQSEQRTGDAILDALGLDRLLVMLRDEAIASGTELGTSMLSDRPADAWGRTVSALNAPSRVGPLMRTRFDAALDPALADEVLAFVTSPLGQRITDLELSARDALNAPGIEAAVLERDAAMRRDDHPRIALIDRFIRVNDLIDTNVVGALNANAAFLTGLREGVRDSGRVNVPSGDVAAEVWRQEPEIRASTTDWVRAFAALAYQPLSDAEMRRYVEFSESPAGQALNTALFAAFDAVFVSTSRETGAALAQLMNSEEL